MIKKELKLLTDIVISYINGMSNKEVSYSNINFLFKRNPILKAFAIGCVNRVEDKGGDSRGLSIWFSNSFSNHDRCLDTESIIEGGKYILDVPDVLIERAMLWLTEQVIEDSSYRCNRGGIPQRALESNSTFDEFILDAGKKGK
jgi:hypothetical protein